MRPPGEPVPEIVSPLLTGPPALISKVLNERREDALGNRLDVVSRIRFGTMKVGFTHQDIISEDQQAQERLQCLGLAIGCFQLFRIHPLCFGS